MAILLQSGQCPAEELVYVITLGDDADLIDAEAHTLVLLIDLDAREDIALDDTLVLSSLA